MKIFFIVLFCVLIPFQAFGDPVNGIKVAAGLSVEPYIIAADDSGLEVDIVREIMQLEGQNVQFVYQPLRRTKVSFQMGMVDGVMTTKADYPEIRSTFISEEYITYQNVAVSLQSRNLKISSISDLKNIKMDAFQQARFALGKEFELMTLNNPNYHEIANQKHQIAKLFSGRTDVIIIDKRIFDYYWKRMDGSPDNQTKSISFNQPVTFHNLFEPTLYRMAFKSEKIRDSFNIGLKRLKESGRYNQIIESYGNK